IVSATAPPAIARRVVRRATPAWLNGRPIRAFACAIKLGPWVIGPLSLMNRHAMPTAAPAAHREALDARTVMWLSCSGPARAERFAPSVSARPETAGLH